MCTSERINSIVIICSRSPCIGRMTYFAGFRNIGSNMVWIFSLVILRSVTIDTNFRSIGISVRMAINTGNCGVGACEWVYGSMIECRWNPGNLRMAGFASGKKFGCNMVGLCSLVICRSVTAKTGIRRIGIIPVMTGSTIIGNRNMSTGNNIIIVMHRECGRNPSGIGCMTSAAFIRNTEFSMVWIRSLAVFVGMARCAVR